MRGAGDAGAATGGQQPKLAGNALSPPCYCWMLSLSAGGECKVSLSVWIVVQGAVSIPLAQLPDMGSMDLLTGVAAALMALYSAIAVALSIVDGAWRLRCRCCCCW